MADERPAEERRSRFPFLPILLAGVGSGLAAVLLARLGLVGTVIGAALTPIIIITVQELGQRPVQRVAAVGRVVREGSGGTAVIRRLRPWERVRWRRVLVLASAAFALTVVTFTVVEMALDRPVATDRRTGILGTRPSSDPAPRDRTTSEDTEGRTPAPVGGGDTRPETSATTVETDTGATVTEQAPTGTTAPEDPTTPTTPTTATTAPDPAATAPGATSSGEPSTSPSDDPAAPTTTVP